MMSTGFELSMQGGVDAAYAARRAIEANDPALPPTVRDDVALLVTELVTNAVLHGGARTDRPIKLEFRRESGQIRVEVIDPGAEFQSPSSPPNGDSSGGWGLFFVDKIAQRWGIRPAPSGTCVWFEMPAGVPP
jgi:anti-sigma regulatory factor (Ser/Thr protein kinase)